MTDKPAKEGPKRDDRRDSTALALPGFGVQRVFEDLIQPFDEYLQSFFPQSFGSLWTEFGGKEPNIDFQDRGDHYVLTAELPGFDKKDVDVKISDKVLELTGEKKSEKEAKNKDGSVIRRSSSCIQRYMKLPEEVVSEKVSGTMKNGVLELKLPKKEPKAMDRSRKVDLK